MQSKKGTKKKPKSCGTSINHKWKRERVEMWDMTWAEWMTERIFLERWSPNQFDWINYKCKECKSVNINKLICESERVRERVREWEWKKKKEWEVWDWKIDPPQFSTSQHFDRTLLRHQMLAGEKKRNRKRKMRFNFSINKSEVMRWKVNHCAQHTLK